MTRLVVAMTVLCGLMVASAMAVEAPAAAPAATVVTGTVGATADAAGAVTAATITAGDVVYNVTLDEKGKAVAALKGKKVEAKGAVAEKDGKKWITVAEVKEIVE